jgi:hypothetical protein
MAQQLINIGDHPSDGSGDPIRVAFDKTNQNFTDLYGNLTLSFTSNIDALSNTVANLSSEVASLTSNVTVLTGDIATLTGDIATLNSDLANLTSNVASLTSSVYTQTEVDQLLLNITNSNMVLRPAPATSIGVSGDVSGMFAIDSTYFYYCTAPYNGINLIWIRSAYSGATW